MREKLFYVIIFGTPLLLIILNSIFSILSTFNNQPPLFMGLEPKAIYKEYKIYDVVEQKGLACAEAIEILASDNEYVYYFNCLKSDKIYFVSNNEVMRVKEVYERDIITKEKLYELGIISRMVNSFGE